MPVSGHCIFCAGRGIDCIYRDRRSCLAREMLPLANVCDLAGFSVALGNTSIFPAPDMGKP